LEGTVEQNGEMDNDKKSLRLVDRANRTSMVRSVKAVVELQKRALRQRHATSFTGCLRGEDYAFQRADMSHNAAAASP